ncbi:MAG: hypothetical protein KA354_19765 [Phycisphaerae bacterium]|nr:hypothetical protein [Phycisphaerae bacterium]
MIKPCLRAVGANLGLLATVFCYGSAIAALAGDPATKPAQEEETLSPLQASRLMQLADAEANIKALNDALRKLGYKVGAAYGRIERAQAANEAMDRKGGGPVGWQTFYGRTARDFAARHYVGNRVWRGLRGAGAVHRDGVSGQLARPKQFDYIYRANDEQAARAKAQATALAQDQEKLLVRRQKHETDQSSLWAQLAWQRVADLEIGSKPLYRFKVKSPTARDPRAEIVRALALFIRTADQAAIDGLKTVEADQEGTFGGLNARMTVAYEALRKSLADSLDAADSLKTDDRRQAEEMLTSCKEVFEYCTVVGTNYRNALDRDRAREDNSKLAFREQLQASLAGFAAAVADLHDQLGAAAQAWGISYEKGVVTSDAVPAMPVGPGTKPGPESASPEKAEPAADMGSRTVDLLKLVDPARDAVAGAWTLEKGVLFSRPRRDNRSRIEFPYTPPEEYDYRVVFVRIGGKDAISPICRANGRQFCCVVGGSGNTVVGFAMINGHHANENRTTRKSNAWLVNDQRYTLVIKVRNDGAQALLDDKPIASINTNYDDVGMPGPLNLSRADVIGLVAGSPCRVESAQVIEVTGVGKKLR